MAAEPGLTLTIYTAEPGSPSEDALRLLASWAASEDVNLTARKLPTRGPTPNGSVGSVAVKAGTVAGFGFAGRTADAVRGRGGSLR